MHRLNSGAALALATLLLSTPAVVVAQAAPGFLQGDWNVASDYVLADGSTEQTTAVAKVREEVIVGTTTHIRHTLVGSREGRPLEVATTFALNPANSQWVLMQADSVAGTVDIAAGAANASGDAWQFTSFAASRPDGGLERFDYVNITADSFTLSVSRSFDGGTVWEPFWTLAYTRAAAPVITSPLPAATTCTQQEYGEFDFWLGEWDLVSAAGQSSGDRSSVRLATGDCVVEETFLPASGGGVSRSMYDGRTGEWARVWLEPGRMLVFISGGIENGDMIMLGGTTGSAQLTNRSIWEPQGANRVRQFTQTSANNGATWTNSGFDAIYVPRGTATPPPPPPPPSGGGGGGALGGLELLLASLLLLLKKPAVRLTLLGLVLAGCGGGGGGGSAAPPSTATPYQYVMPAQLNDGWAVENATAEGVDVARLGSMMNAIRQNGQDGYLRNILVVRNNKLVFEEYFADGGRDSLSHMQSATKSIVAAIFGIAVSEGYVASLDDSLFGYFPEYAQYASAEKDAVRVRHVLSMTPGFDWNENSAPTFGTENDNIAAYRSNNYIGYLLQKNLVTTPGAAWNYNSGCPMLLAGIIRNQSGVHLDDFAEQRFFGAMGISRLRWEYQADGLPLATGGLWLRGRDAAKIGQLFLDGGSWQGQQVVPADWVEQSLTQVISPGSGRGYGFLWWTQQRSGRRIWYAAGYGGQLIVLVPSESAIIITNANYVRDGAENNRRQAAIWNLLDSYILPAL